MRNAVCWLTVGRRMVDGARQVGRCRASGHRRVGSATLVALCAFLVALPGGLVAQCSVWFSISDYCGGCGLRAAVFDVDCTNRLSGPSFVAGLYVGSAPGNLVFCPASRTPFQTGRDAGHWIPVDLMGFLGCTTCDGHFYQARAWEARFGTYEIASHSGGKLGQGPLVFAAFPETIPPSRFAYPDVASTPYVYRRPRRSRCPRPIKPPPSAKPLASASWLTARRR